MGNDVFALVIGINDYFAKDDFVALQGAVNDSRAFVKFLLDPVEQHGLGASPENIVQLENEKATRQGILSAFETHFLNNEKIPDHGDATMILFFAGHGARMSVQGTAIEVLCPVDERTVDVAGSTVYAIPDYVLGWLLAELERKKGPNITVILDSCHSGGMNRREDDLGLVRAASSPSEEVPATLDAHFWPNGRAATKNYRLWAPTSSSHILLAACRQEEQAREGWSTDGLMHGRFTAKLLSRLRGLPLHHTTYEELIAYLPRLPDQTPHCGGQRRHSLVFDGFFSFPGSESWSFRRVSIEGTQFENYPSWVINAGTVEGVVPGTEFSVRLPDSKSTVFCTLVARTVQINHTIVIPDITSRADQTWKNIVPGSRAVISNWKNSSIISHVFVSSTFQYTNHLFPSNLQRHQAGMLFVQAATENGADISLSNEDNELVIQWHTQKKLGKVRPETRLKLEAKQIENLPLIIDGLVRFCYFLERENEAWLMTGVSLEMHRVDGLPPISKPDSKFGINGNLVENGVVQLVSQDDAYYGFTVRNESGHDLFPYMFFFDPVRYTIDLWYEPPDGRVLSPLRAGSTLTVGMGTEDGIEFFLEPDETTSSGFVKLFFATSSLELGWIAQAQSPLDPSFVDRNRSDTDEVIDDKTQGAQQWGALDVLVTMIQA